MREVRRRIAGGDTYAEMIMNAMIHQIKKEIGAMVAALDGQVDAIILTAGVSHDRELVESLRKSLSYAAPVIAMPGEFEMEALARGRAERADRR